MRAWSWLRGFGAWLTGTRLADRVHRREDGPVVLDPDVPEVVRVKGTNREAGIG